MNLIKDHLHFRKTQMLRSLVEWGVSKIIPSVSPQRLSKQRLFKDTRLRLIIDVSCRESSWRKDGDDHFCLETIHICNAEASWEFQTYVSGIWRRYLFKQNLIDV